MEFLKCYWRWDEEQLKENEINTVIYAGKQTTFFMASFLNFQGLGFFLYLALGKVSVLSYLMSQNFLNGTVQYQITEKYFIKQSWKRQQENN